MSEDQFNQSTHASFEDREIIVTRYFDAPQALVFKAWTEPKHLIQWWGPEGFTHTIQELDVKQGGIWRFIMHAPDGTDYPNEIHFLEIDEPNRLVYAHGGDNDEQHHVKVDFVQQGTQTKLTMKMRFASVAERIRITEEYGAVEAAKSTLSRLAEVLTQMKKTQI